MSLSQVYGQDFNVSVLRTYLYRNNLPHALLFWGPNGVGKRKVAVELSKLLNCQHRQNISSPDNVDCCNECASCRKIDNIIHPDVQIHEPDGDAFGIDQILKLSAEVKYKPFEGEVKVYILTQVERFSGEAANCILKILEEPPDNVVFVLLATNRSIVIPTIRTRCQLFYFRPLNEKLIVQILQNLYQIDLNLAVRIARLSAGSMETAKLLYDTDFFNRTEKLRYIWRNLNKVSYPLWEEESNKFITEISKSISVNVPDQVAEQLSELEDSVKSKKTKLAIQRYLFYWTLVITEPENNDWNFRIQGLKYIQKAITQIRLNLNRQLVMDTLWLNLKSIKPIII